LLSRPADELTIDLRGTPRRRTDVPAPRVVAYMTGLALLVAIIAVGLTVAAMADDLDPIHVSIAKSILVAGGGLVLTAAYLTWQIHRHIGAVSIQLARFAALQEQIVGRLAQLQGVPPDGAAPVGRVSLASIQADIRSMNGNVPRGGLVGIDGEAVRSARTIARRLMES
jgi:uncharacterized membrane protein (Fun14 family)